MCLRVYVFTSGQLTDPLVFGVAQLRHERVGQVTVRSTVPPVILLALIINERSHHLHKDKSVTLHGALMGYQDTQ